MRLYIDGSPACSVPWTGERAPNVLGIGYNPFGPGSAYFAGCLDEVRLKEVCRPPAPR